MKQLAICLVLVLLCSTQFYAQNVAINNTGAPPDPSAMLDVSAVDKGVLVPRVDHTTIGAPALGLLVFNPITESFWYHNGVDWTEIMYGHRNDADHDPLNETNISANLAGTTLNITDAGGAKSVDLSPLAAPDDDWVDGTDVIFNTQDRVGIGLSNPIVKLDVNSTTVSGIAAVRAEGQLNGKGYLGVQGTLNYDGIANLDISGYEIGVLGVSDGSSELDNYGVYGYSNNIGGYFMHSDSGYYAGLGMENWAGYFNGKSLFDGPVLINNYAVNAQLDVEGVASSIEPVVLVRSNYTGTEDVKALYARSDEVGGHGIGVNGRGGWFGILGQGVGDAFTGSVYGGYFTSEGTAGTRYGTFHSAHGTGNTNYGLFATATDATNNWAGWFEAGHVNVTDRLYIGGYNPTILPEESIHVSSGGVRIDAEVSNPAERTLYGNSIPLAYGYVAGTTIQTDYGIASVTSPGIGNYDVTLDRSFVGAPVVIVTTYNLSTEDEIATYSYSSSNIIHVRISNGAGTATTSNFSIVVFGNTGS